MNKRLLAITVLAMVCAVLISEFLYWNLLVPRLPQYFHVPLSWWIAVFSPFAIAAISTGVQIKTARFVVLYAIVAALVVLVTRMIFLFSLGKPPAHDARWNDSYYIVETIPSFLIISLTFLFGMYTGHFIPFVLRRSK